MRKKSRLITITAVTMLLVLCMTGCAKKTAISADSFASTMKDNGYTVADTKDQFADNEGILTAQIAVDKDATHQIEFYEMSKDMVAMAMFEGTEEHIKEIKDADSVWKSIESKNSRKYSVSGSKNYYCVSRVGSTILYVHATSEGADAAKKMIKELGY